MNSFANQSFETINYLRVKGMISLYLIDLLNGLVYCFFVLLFSLDSEWDGANEGADQIEILKMVREDLVHLWKDLLHYDKIYID